MSKPKRKKREYDEEEYLAELKREFYSDFWQLLEENETDYTYREEE